MLHGDPPPCLHLQFFPGPFTGRAAFLALDERLNKRFALILAALVLANQIPNIITHPAELAIAGLAFDPILHGFGQGNRDSGHEQVLYILISKNIANILNIS